jgi:hypothetical protein
MKAALLAILSLVVVPVLPAQTPDAKPPATAAQAAGPKPRATPTPAPVPTLEGVVKGPDGRPLENARVLAEPVRGAFPFAGFGTGVPLTARTDAAGRFRLALRERRPHTVRVEAPGLAAVRLEKVQPGTPVAVTLAKGAWIEGTVRDGGSGAPMGRVVVEAREDRPGVYAAWDADAGVVRAESDARGRFRLDGLAAGLHSVTARARGFASARRGAVRTGSRADLYLFPGSALVGTVHDAESQPVAKALVRAETESIPIRFSEPPLATTDAAGRFELAGLNAGRYKLVVRAPEFALGLLPGLTVEAGTDTEVNVVLHRGAAVSGRLVGPNEQPVAGRVGVQEIDGAAVPWNAGDLLTTEAGTDGRFQLPALPPGSHTLVITAPGHATQRVPVDVGAGGVPVDVGDVLLETGLAIRGRVRDRAGLPVADAQINGFARGAGFGNMVNGTTEADGSFVLAGLTTGAYRLTVRAPGYGEQSKSVEAGGESTVEFVLDAAGAVTGVAVDEAGRPVDSFRVTARPVREEGGMRFPPRGELVADAEGRFRLEDLAEASYVVVVSAPDRADGVVSNVKVPSGGTVDVGRVRLGAGGTVRGTVTDASGTPVMAATVTIIGPGREFLGPGGGEVLSDAGGTFELRGVPSGIVQVSAQHPQYAEGRVSVEVDPVKGPAETRIALSQGGRVEGSVRRRDGTGIPGVMVQVVALQPGTFASFPGDEMVHTSADGTFSVDHLPAGRVNVMLMVGSGGRYQSGPSKDVEVRDGEVVVADFVSRETLVSGRVTRGGAPAPNLRVNMQEQRRPNMFLSFAAGPAAPPSGPQRGTGLTREDGSYELLLDTPGSYGVNATTADGRLSYPGRTVEVPDADTFVLDLAFSGVPVTGLVVDRETEQPIAAANVWASPREPQPDGAGGGGAATGPDGRFVMEVEPGEYKLNVHAEGYAPDTTDLTVGAGGGSDVRVTLTHGGMISGRVVDTTGRGVGGVHVGASPRGAERRGGGGGQSLPDGSFQIPGLPDGAYDLSAQASNGTFAFRTGVNASQKEVTLTLQPGGQVRLVVRGPDGAPVEGAYARVTSVEGTSVRIGMGNQTSPQGTTDVLVPAGQLELTVSKDKLEGRTAVTVAPGAVVPAEVQLVAKAAAPRSP